jgi:hypothetical protein
MSADILHPQKLQIFGDPEDSTTIAQRLRKGSEKGRKTDKRMIDIQRRNKTIRQRYYELLKQGHPVMLAYAMTGREFYLSEKRIRDIIAGRK